MIIGARPTVARSHAIAHREESPLRNFWYSRDLTRTCTVRWESWSCILLGPCSVGNVTRCGNGTGKKTPGGAGTHKQGTHGTHRNTDHTDEPHKHPLASQPASRRPDPTSTHEEHEHAQKREGTVRYAHALAHHKHPSPQKRPPPANPTLPPPAPRAPPRAAARKRSAKEGARRACSKAVPGSPRQTYARVPVSWYLVAKCDYVPACPGIGGFLYKKGSISTQDMDPR